MQSVRHCKAAGTLAIIIIIKKQNTCRSPPNPLKTGVCFETLKKEGKQRLLIIITPPPSPRTHTLTPLTGCFLLLMIRWISSAGRQDPGCPLRRRLAEEDASKSRGRTLPKHSSAGQSSQFQPSFPVTPPGKGARCPWGLASEGKLSLRWKEVSALGREGRKKYSLREKRR